MMDRSALWKKAAGFLLVAFVLGYSFFLYKKYRVAPKINSYNIELATLDGSAYNLKSLKGQTVFISYFATWCGPCLREFDQLAVAQKALNEEQVVFIAIADEPAEKLKRYVVTYDIGIPVYQSVKPLSELGIHSFPTNYILNKSGEIVYKSAGDVNTDWSSKESIEKIKQFAADGTVQ